MRQAAGATTMGQIYSLSDSKSDVIFDFQGEMLCRRKMLVRCDATALATRGRIQQSKKTIFHALERVLVGNVCV
jgi:hypothetical protein